MNKIFKKAAAAVLALIIGAAQFVMIQPVSAFGEETATVGDFAVTGDSGGYTYANDVLKITSAGSYSISMVDFFYYDETTGYTDRIVVNAIGTVNITIDGLQIYAGYDCPFKIEAGDVILLLKNVSNFVVQPSANAAAINVSGGSLTIKGDDGGLAARGAWGAGIGSNYGGDSSKNITIDSGTVTASSEYGAGIGGGAGGEGSNITINGGTVTASSESGAGIGGGHGYEGSNITINGGTVTASSEYGAGIGGGEGSEGSNITINGGLINASSVYGDAIGSGENGGSSTDISIKGGHFTEGDTSANTVYGITVDDSSYVTDTTNSSIKSSYPYRVRGEDTSDFSISGVNSSGSDITEKTEYTYNKNVLTVKSGGTYNISMNTADYVEYTETDRIVVSVGSGENVTLTITDINAAISEYSPLCLESGNLTLILEGDNNLVTTAENYAALSKNSTDNTLKITSVGGDGKTTGSLTATAGAGAAAIGGDYKNSGSSIEIAGGTVTATGGKNGAAIGGGGYGGGDNIVISGGSVTAKGGSDGAGIGGGSYAAGTNIKITGGTVSASGSSDGAAIGGGYNCGGSSIEITGGTVTADSGSYGAAIGGGYIYDGTSGVNTIKITGGTVTANGVWGAGIGSSNKSGGDSISISSGKISASSAYGNPIGSGYSGSSSTVAITGGYYKTGDLTAQTVYGITPSSGYSVVNSGQTSYLYRVVPSDGRQLEITPDDLWEGFDYTYDDNVLTIINGGTYGITMADGVTSTETDRIAVQADGDVTLTITNINITSSEDAPFRADSGDLTLILEGDNYLTSTYTNYPGLSKTSSSNTLKITSIEGDGKTTGALTATGGSSSAGIGGGNESQGINIEIAGGTVNAICNDNSGAGIGGGKEGYGINITISGGNVTATGGGYGAGIGGGSGGAGQNITISGGTVVATCDRSDTDIRSAGSGIGGGMYGRYAYPESSNITITGGDITAIGGLYGAGIGGGRSCSVTGITISGGTVYAESAYGAAIGAGYGAVGNNITISGGTVNAQSTGAVGIGGSVTGGSGSNVKISNADVTACGLYNGIYATGITISSGTVNASSNFTAIGYEDVTITGGTVTAESTIGAGIGDTNITITGGTVTASGEQGAGIGGGIAGSASGITISGGYIKASSVEGEAIGSGLDGAASENIVITGGYFNEGNQSEGTVCGAEVYTDYYVYLNTEEDTKAAYPYVVTAIGYSKGLVITGEDIAEGEDYTYENNVLTILKAGTYTVTMAEGTVKTPDRIAVNAGGDVNLTIEDINISCSTESPFRAESGNLTLVLSGDSCLTATGANYAALLKETEDYKLIITSINGPGSTEGSLTAAGGESGAGIGGGYNSKGTGIEIAGGTVSASSGQYGAGIGGGRYESGSNITISGGSVTASSTDMGAGIGGGQASDGTSSGSVIVITGGTVSASSSRGAAIGGGYSSKGISLGEDITISGGAVTAASESGAGIGGGANYSGETAAGSYARGIRIAGGTVTASGYSAIGCGSTSGTAEAEAPVIDGGSVKADGSFTTGPINSYGEALALYTVENTTEGEQITINGKTYVESVVYHSDGDTNQYIYLTGADLILLGLLGDVDGDGDVDKADGALLLKYLSNLTVLGEESLGVSDCNLDGNIDLTDVTALLKSVNS